MSLNAQSYQFLNQQGLVRLVDVTGGPDGPQSTVSYWLVPANGYISGQRVPYDVNEDLGNQNFDKTTVEGIEYFLVPEESTNTPGLLSHYAQRTGVAELQNPRGGVNRVRETLEASSEATVAPDAVSKYVDNNDAYEEARTKASEEDQRVSRQVSTSPAREPAEGKLVVAEAADTSTPDPSDGRKRAGGTKTSSEKEVSTTGETKA